MLQRLARLATRTAQIGLCSIALAILLANMPGLLGYRSLIVLSGSMAPAIGVGSVVAVAPVDVEALRIGDVITFHDPQRPAVLITHRIIGIEGTPGDRAFRTKGDANEDADFGTLPERFVVGRVAFSIPLVGYVQGFAGQPAGMLIVFLLAIVAALGLIRAPDRRPVDAAVRPDASANAAVPDRSDVEVLLLLARGAQQAGLMPRAFGFACQATERAPANVEAWLARAEMAPNFEEAMRALEEAVRIDPDHPRARAGLSAVRPFSEAPCEPGN